MDIEILEDFIKELRQIEPNMSSTIFTPSLKKDQVWIINEIIKMAEDKVLINKKANSMKKMEISNSHYDNTNGSLYLFAEQHKLNAYEFDLIKRIVRCRKKGEFLSDLEKVKTVIDLYLKEQGHLYEGQVEQLNKK
jgi:hypothetical protein